ncbi:MAG: nitrate/nitrite transporter [Rhizobiaceae bacterium]
MRLVTIILLLAAGILAGTQLGKIAPLVGWYRSGAGFSLVMIGWLAALIAVFVAVAALPAGWVIHRIGTRKAVVFSFVVLAVGGVALALAASPWLVLAARLVEGVGYLLLVIAVPALLSDMSPPAWRGAVLAVWGGFVPIGFAIANFLAAAVIPTAGEQVFLLWAVGLFAVFAVPSGLLIGRVRDFDAAESDSGETVTLAQSLNRNIWLLSLAFGLYVISSIGFFTFMPTFVTETGERFLISAGVIALLVPGGNVLAGLMLQGREGRFAARLTVAGFLATALFAVPAFAATSPAIATLCAGVVAVGGGVVASALFAAIPYFVPRGGSVSISIGLVAQAGGLGTLVGPPLAGWIIEVWSWPGLGVFLSLTAAFGIVAALPLALVRNGPSWQRQQA